MTYGSENGSSVVRRWQLAALLKSLREQAGLTQEQVIERLRSAGGKWSHSKLSRVENREYAVKPREAEQLLDIYGVRDVDRRGEVLQLASTARGRGWWTSFATDLPGDVRPLLSIESELVAVRDFQNMLVHGLLQTADYTRALMNTVNPALFAPEDLERRVAARMVRQQLLNRTEPPQLHFILDQVILDRVVGRPSVMRDQLRKLLDVTEQPNITIQILPHEAGGSPGLEGPFSILTLPDPIPDIGYTEGPAGSLYIEDREQVRTRTLRFGILTRMALSRTESADLIAATMKRYE